MSSMLQAAEKTECWHRARSKSKKECRRGEEAVRSGEGEDWGKRDLEDTGEDLAGWGVQRQLQLQSQNWSCCLPFPTSYSVKEFWTVRRQICVILAEVSPSNTSYNYANPCALASCSLQNSPLQKPAVNMAASALHPKPQPTLTPLPHIISDVISFILKRIYA